MSSCETQMSAAGAQVQKLAGNTNAANSSRFRARCICFTKPRKDEHSPINHDAPVIGIEKKINYYVYQPEKSNETGYEHWQGYMEAECALSLKTWKTILGEETHIERRRGSQKQAIAYCKKADTAVGDWHEWGIPKKQGERTDIKHAAKMMLTNREVEVADAHVATYVKFYKGLNKFRDIHVQPRKDKPRVIVLYGPSGAGKSRRAYEMTCNAYWKDPTTKWWDGYEYNKQVVIDDYKGGWELAYLLRVLDRYPMRVEVKGSTMEFVSDTIIITSIMHPNEWHTMEGEDTTQITRRIDEIIKIDRESSGGDKSPKPPAGVV